ncbi:hypothetical protein K449DRAFT_385333 [Hypoxylon sp. EC38]|nr:hypothetical protein K449DRAFT_385333 [Hypoxylon sp. EC38]
METLPCTMLLEVVERLDVKSTLKLMETSKSICDLIRNYQFSISMAQVARFTMPPVGNVLSSEVFERRCIQHGTFEMALEMEQREARINDILSNSGYINFVTPLQLGPLNVTQQKKLYDLLKRAMQHCDRIADIAANKPCSPIGRLWYIQLEKKRFEAFDMPIGFRLKDPITNLGARQAQLEYINSLSAEDLAMIYYLLAAMAQGYYRESEEWVPSDPIFIERQTVFRECVLRHGTWFTWSHIRGDKSWKNMAYAIIRVALVELTSFEFGMDPEDEEETPPSLQSALMDRFGVLYQCEDDSGWAPEMFKVVRRIVKGTREADEVKGEEDAEDAAEDETVQEDDDQAEQEDQAKEEGDEN